MPTGYTKLVFDAVRDGEIEKTVKFNSFTFGGQEEDRQQDEYVMVRTVDESVPETAVSYSSTAPTNQPVIASITVGDPQTGIATVERMDGEVYTDITAGSAIYRAEFAENGTRTYRVTNGAGMVSEVTATVSNIDTTPIVENTHYTVNYEYQNYLEAWTATTEGGAYRAVKATIVPTQGSNKTVTALNNTGGLSKILTSADQNFVFQLGDTAGNRATQEVKWEGYDTQPGTIRWELSNTKKTNQPVNATVTIADADKVNDIVHAEIWDEMEAGRKKLTWVGTPQEDIYTVELAHSGLYTVKAWDLAGNSWSQTITVTNIDTEVPKIKTMQYSTAQNVVTAQSVRAEIVEFTKPTLEAVAVLAQDTLSVDVAFRQQKDQYDVPLDIFRNLSDLSVSYRGAAYKADAAHFTLKSNGSYRFSVFDSAGNTQFIDLEVAGIDDVAPKITQVTWLYNYQEQSTTGEWTTARQEKTLVIGEDTSGSEAGYAIGPDKYPVTNSDAAGTQARPGAGAGVHRGDDGRQKPRICLR